MTECIHECECNSYAIDLDVMRAALARTHESAARLRHVIAETERKLSEAADQRDRAIQERDAARAIVANVRRAMDAMVQNASNHKVHGANHDHQSDRQPQGTRNRHHLCR